MPYAALKVPCVQRPKFCPIFVPTGWPESSLPVANRLPVRPSAFDQRGSAPAFHRSFGATLTLKLCPASRLTVLAPVPPELLLA